MSRYAPTWYGLSKFAHVCYVLLCLVHYCPHADNPCYRHVCSVSLFRVLSIRYFSLLFLWPCLGHDGPTPQPGEPNRLYPDRAHVSAQCMYDSSYVLQCTRTRSYCLAWAVRLFDLCACAQRQQPNVIGCIRTKRRWLGVVRLGMSA